MSVIKRIIDIKKIKTGILEIKALQEKYHQTSTIIVYHALDTALNELGWSFAKLLEREKKEKND